MKREIITINDSGAVSVPSEVRMCVSEIADLFGLYTQIVRANIKAVIKSGVADGDYSMTCIADKHGVTPYYYGLEMIIAVAFRVKSAKADVFRRWVIKRFCEKKQTICINPVFFRDMHLN